MINHQIDFNHTAVELFEIQANKTPLHIAVSDTTTALTYRALNERTNQFANWLQKKVNPGDFVGILLDPGVDYIICILAIIKAGAVYLPLDSMAPELRLAEILNDAQPKLIITGEQYSDHLNKYDFDVHLIKQLHLESLSYPRLNNQHRITPGSPIYMMYTSGSTGRPKGVIISHQSVVNLAKVDNFAKVKEKERVAQFSNLAFDGSTFEIWSALLNGATLIVVPYNARNDHANLKNFLKANTIKYLFLPTGFFHQLIKSAMNTLNYVEVIIFGGEQVNTLLLNNLTEYRKKNNLPVVLINGYGPTEATTFTCRQVMDENGLEDEEQLASIGKKIDNVTLYVLDENKEPVAEGELYISGINVALGYHNCPVQNEEKFIANPFSKQVPYDRLYKTGDRVRLLPSGDLFFLGRLDDQVKIGGFRIHLNEIENQLMHHPFISLAAVRVEMGGGSHQMLTAYIVLSSSNNTIHADEIRDYLSKTLPTYMLPAKYVLVEDLPLTLVGKVDKAKLDQIPHTDLSFHVDTPPASIIEEKIKTIWQHLLNRKTIDVNKNLFELGANSLLITEACFRINEALQSELQVANILSYPTIHKLSLYLDGNIEKPVAKKIQAVHCTEIAIIGMACRFPKANSLDEYWQNLCQGENCLTRFDEKDLNKANNNRLWDTDFVPVRGVLDDIEKFDANFFGFNPVDASTTDPQQRLFLECAWEALEHAAVAPQKLSTKTISVFAGMADSTYLQENLLKNNWFLKEHDRFQSRIVSSASMLSTQISYRLNLRGRSINVNTACSTGLVTVDQACQDLTSGHCDIALAGAVSIVVPQENGYIYQKGSIESSDGQCRPFSSDANGTVFSNGVGVVILKRLDDAIADKDTIYAVIKGRGINNDGSDKLGFTAPSTSGQTSCIRDALAQAGIKAEDIGYVEAHGTATILGDAIEFDALTTVYREQTEKKQFCVLGSVKGNIGHTDVAAGIAGLIKAALCLHYQKIPSTLHFDKPNSNIAFHDSPFFINKELLVWQTESLTRYAGVSAFGVGGTNVHLILANHNCQQMPVSTESEQLFILSAKTEKALEQNTEKLIQHLSKFPKGRAKTYLANVAHTLQEGRDDFQWRRIGIGKTITEIKKNLSQNKVHRCSENSSHDLVFMFPGQGMQYHRMAAQLMAEIPCFAQYVNYGIQLAKSYLNCDLLEIMSNPQDERLNQTQYAQPALFIIEYGLAKLLMECGVMPQAFIGHSLGEYVAACLAGVFSFEDAIAIVCERGLLMASTPTGAMLAIDCTVEEFAVYQDRVPGVELASHNASNHCVASGEESAIRTLEGHLSTLNKSYQTLRVTHAFHSYSMEAIEQPFKEIFLNIPLSAPTIPMISNLTGDWLTAEDAVNPEYWYRHLRHSVKLRAGLEVLIGNEHPFFIEVGPGHSLNTFLNVMTRNSSKKPLLLHTLPNQNRPTDDLTQLLIALGTLWQEGVSIQWAALRRSDGLQRIPLPTYSFQKQRYWIEPDDRITSDTNQPALYKPVWSRQPAYLKPVSSAFTSLKQHSWIIFKDKSGISEQFISLLQQHNAQLIIIEADTSYRELSLHHFKLNPAIKAHYDALFKRIKRELRAPIILHAYSCDNLEADLSHNEEINQQLTAGFYSVLYLIQSYIEQIGEQLPLRCTLLTRGTQQVLGTEKIIPINASLTGACRVIPQEHPLLQCRLIDLNPDEPAFYDGKLFTHILNECVRDAWSEPYSMTAYRHGYQWDLTYALAKPQLVQDRLKDSGVYLVTGGLGGIALALCEAIAKQVSKPTFILFSRTPVILESEWDTILNDPENKMYKKIRSLKALQTLGATLAFHTVDLTDYKSLSIEIKACKSSFGQINGVLHCAGIAGSGLMQLKSHDKAQAVLMPKIHGTYYLARALHDLSLDFVVLMSSIAALTGEQGQIDYCGANACLDTFAQSQLFSADVVLSLNWNTWRDIGMAVETLKPADVTFFDRGNDISPQQGQQLFLQAIQTNFSNLAVSNYALERYASRVSKKKESSEQSNVKAAREDLDVGSDYQAPRNDVEEQLVVLWQECLGIESIGVDDDFFDLGGHSLKALNLIKKINNRFHVALAINQLYRTPTISRLAEVFTKKAASKSYDIIVPLKTTENKSLQTPALFVCHPVSGMVYCYNSFVAQSPANWSIYGLQDPSVDAGHILYNSVSSMADDYLTMIKTIQPQGPYYLVGYSFGGSLFYEVAARLKQQEETIGLLALIEGWASFSSEQANETNFKRMLNTYHHELPTDLINLAWHRMQLLLAHTPTTLKQEMLLFKAKELFDQYQSIDNPTNGWANFNNGVIQCHLMDANHETILNAENCQQIMNYIKDYCNFTS